MKEPPSLPATPDSLLSSAAELGGDKELREALSVLLMSEELLGRYGWRLSEEQQQQQLAAMHEAGRQLSAALNPSPTNQPPP